MSKEAAQAHGGWGISSRGQRSRTPWQRSPVSPPTEETGNPRRLLGGGAPGDTCRNGPFSPRRLHETRACVHRALTAHATFCRTLKNLSAKASLSIQLWWPCAFHAGGRRHRGCSSNHAQTVQREARGADMGRETPAVPGLLCDKALIRLGAACGKLWNTIDKLLFIL